MSLHCQFATSDVRACAKGLAPLGSQPMVAVIWIGAAAVGFLVGQTVHWFYWVLALLLVTCSIWND